MLNNFFIYQIFIFLLQVGSELDFYRDDFLFFMRKTKLTELSGFIEHCLKRKQGRYIALSFLEEEKLLTISYRFKERFLGKVLYDSISQRLAKGSRCYAKLKVKGSLERNKIEYCGVGSIDLSNNTRMFRGS